MPQPHPHRFDPAQGQLWRGTQAVKLTGKAFGVLQYFVAHPGQLVTKDEEVGQAEGVRLKAGG